MAILIPRTDIIDINKLSSDGKNPNKMTKKQHAALNHSIGKYGFIIPIITNKDLLIADGEQRWTVAKSMGLKQVPVVVLPIKDVDRRILRQVLNKLRGEHEQLLDLDEYKLIFADGGKDELKSLLAMQDKEFHFVNEYIRGLGLPEQNDEIPTKVSSIVKRGDLWTLGKHRLLCGDSTKEDEVKRLMNGKKADMVFTDPPYNTGMTEKSQSQPNKRLESKNGSTRLSHMFNDSFTDEEWQLFISKFTKIYYEILKDDAVAYICLDWRRNHELIPHIKNAGFTLSNIIVWDKMIHGLGSDYKYTYEVINVCKKGNPELNTHQGYREYSDVWHIERKIGKDEDHATKKPIELCERAIRHVLNVTVVVDLFGGSGSTLLSCERLNKQCFMMELDERYCDVIIARWENLTGKKAVKVL